MRHAIQTARTGAAAAAMLAALALVGCNSSTQALDTTPQQQAAQQQATPDAEQTAEAGGAEAEPPATETAQATQGANVIRQQPNVSQRGTYIRALVNGEPITNFDINRRIKFRQLRRSGGDREAALEELVDQQLKLQAARRAGTLAGDDQVDAAFANFARNNRSNPQRISGDLERLGVGADHFKEFIRTEISWTNTLGRQMQAERRRSSETDAIFALRKTSGEKPETTEYILQQIIFVVPEQERRQALLKARRTEALTFGQQFTNCDDSFALAKQLRDVAVKDLGRYLEPELPALWKDEIIETEIGKTTRPKETERGIEIVAVCSSRTASDDLAAKVVKRAQAFESISEDSSEEGEELLKKLRESASIIYR